jgi:predicted DNA-binding transcriptional regulator YafY
MHAFTIDELLEEINKKIEQTDGKAHVIKLRQLRYDIAHMKSPEGWSIELVEEKLGKKQIYRYADEKFSIFNAPLSEFQIEEIKSIASLIEGYSSNPEINQMLNVLDTLKLTADNSRHHRKIISVGINPDLKGREHLIPLYNIIKDQNVIELKYQPFGADEPKLVTTHPQYLKEYNSRWFLFGVLDEDRNKIQNYALDRIVSFKARKTKKYHEAEIDWEDEYFADIIGVSNVPEESAQLIRLRFLNGRGHYVETKPLHPSQKKMNWIDQTTSETTIFVKVNRELQSTIQGFGDDVKVISPKGIFNKFKAVQ